MSKITAEELANEFSNFANNFNVDEEAFVNAFFRQHRTLQQSMMGLMFKVIEKAASGDIGTDPRNQASIDTCKKMVEGFKIGFKAELIASGMDEDKAEAQVNNEHVKASNLPCI